MSKKTLWIFLVIHLFTNPLDGTKTAGLIAEKRMNMNILKMFDRFFYIRHKDEFFIRNFKKYLTDDYFKSLYGEEFKMTRTLKKDLSMHATYLENTGDMNEEKAAKCRKVEKYLYSFLTIALEEYLKRADDFFYFIFGGAQPHPYKDFFYALSRYFYHVRSAIGRKHLKSEDSISEKEYLESLLLQEMETPRNDRLKLKYFFRNFFFGTPIKNNDFLKKKLEEEKQALSDKELKFIQNETIKFWEIAYDLAQAIDRRNPLTPQKNSRKTATGDLLVEMIVKSNVARMIRTLEVRRLLAQGIKLEPEGIFKLKNGIEEEIHQLFVDPSNPLGQQLKFVSLEPKSLNNLPIDINHYVNMGKMLAEEEFSDETKKKDSDENYYNALDQSLKSATNESYKTIRNGSVDSSSKPISNGSMMHLNRLKVENLRRSMEARLSHELAKKSTKNDFRSADDVSHLKSYMAPTYLGNKSEVIVDQSINSPEENISNYSEGDIDQGASLSNTQRKHKSTRFRNKNFSKQNLESSNQLVSVY